MPRAGRERQSDGDDQALPESERGLLEDEEEKLPTDKYHAAPRSSNPRLSLRMIALVQTALITLLSAVLVIELLVRDNRICQRCAARLNTGSKSFSAQDPIGWPELTRA